MNGVKFAITMKFAKLSITKEKRTRDCGSGEEIVFDEEDCDRIMFPNHDALVIILRINALDVK